MTAECERIVRCFLSHRCGTNLGNIPRFQASRLAGSNLISLTVDEFEQLVSPFEAAFVQHMRDWTIEAHPRTAQAYCPYTNSPLPACQPSRYVSGPRVLPLTSPAPYNDAGRQAAPQPRSNRPGRAA